MKNGKLLVISENGKSHLIIIHMGSKIGMKRKINTVAKKIIVTLIFIIHTS